MSGANFRILVVDDEPTTTDFISYTLKNEGFQVDAASTAEDALALSDEYTYDLFVLDIVLPGMNGYDLCRRLRTKSSAPVLFVSIRDTELDKVVGLEIGGDDYLVKPFGMHEFVARVHALLRRISQSDVCAKDGRVISAGGIVLNEGAHTVGGVRGDLYLTPREFELLACLMENAGKVVSREDLLRNAWGWDYLTDTKTVDTHIKRLRDKVEEAGYGSNLIETVRGYGYKFKAESLCLDQ